METLGNFHFNLTYRPGHELLQADALSRIYVQQSKSDSALDPDWPMWYPLVKNNSYPLEVSSKTLEKLVKNKEKFKVDQGTVLGGRKMDFCQRLYLFLNGSKLYLGTTAILVTLAPTTSTCSFVVKSGGQIC